ncbi:hypothetical protein [Eubacterium oxidoreducens]|uniref:Ribosomal protein L14E/L6E/L27E n=1 Tax=Eubacterium oxidoreducens TaxID=1732 RepID=A0A1G6CG22_EUBOX|nr:hypothetical protein [Eubacterium oxidoreducens]SDB31823.1 hypothetical protein SAMN02910417_02361 [Eubacterium oxidoreducens]
MIRLARSKAGHDTGKVYYICKEDDNYYYLTDGYLKKIEHPKKKKKKHLQLITQIPQKVVDILSEDVQDENAQIRKALKAYQDR